MIRNITKILPSGSGGAKPLKNVSKSFKLIRFGCANRPFYHIVVSHTKRRVTELPIEQVGVYDPMVNQNNEQIVSLNLDRIHYWLGEGVQATDPVAHLFGLAGLFPIHPRTKMMVWRNKIKESERLLNDKNTEKVEPSPSEQT